MKTTLAYLCAIGCAFIWMTIFAPLIARFFGVPYKIAFWRSDRANKHLSRNQYLWCFGILDYGLGMLLLFNLLRFLEWKILANKTKAPDIRFELIQLVVCMVVGLVVGSITAPKENGTT